MKQWTTTEDFINNGKIPASAQEGFIVATEGYYAKGDDGGAQWRFTGLTGQTPSQSSSLLNSNKLTDADGNVFELVSGAINVKALGYVGDGVADEKPVIEAAGSTGKSLFIPGPSICNLDSNAQVTIDTQVETDNGVAFAGVGVISGIGIADQSLVEKNSGFLGLADEETGTRIGKYLSYRKIGTPVSDSESDALLVIATQDQDSTSFSADLVGVGARAYIPGSNSNGRAWALNAYARVASGGDGLVHGAEVNIENFGSDNPTPDTALAKYGVNITTKPGSNPATAAIKIGSGSDFHYGIWATQSSLVSSTSSFITLNNLFDIDGQGRVSIGSENHNEQLNVDKASGRSQVAITSDGTGGEASTKYTDAGTRNWTTGHWFDTGRYTISTTSNLASGRVFEIDGNGNVGINGFSNGSGQGGMFIANASVAPTTNPSGGGILYVEGGELKYKASSGTVTVIGPL